VTHGSNLGAMGLVGFLLFLAGLHLLWQGRHEVIFWMDEFFRIFRGEFTKRAGAPADVPSNDAAISTKRYRGTLRLIAAFGLMMLGPLLFLIDLRH
jgi:hypothetical protein